MKDQLAERLLARVMNWTPENVSAERPFLQAMAAYKYDEYQRYFAGQRFVESLALWLNDLQGPGEKELAYKFVRSSLVFFSSAEINHLVNIAYPDFIRPHLVEAAALNSGINPYHVSRVVRAPQFALSIRSCLFLGLSEGARTDVFRRSNEGAVNHEQVLQTYEISKERVPKLLEKLREALKAKFPTDTSLENACFQTIVLLDDFSASGTSYLRMEGDKAKGKIAEFTSTLLDASHPNSALVEHNKFEILLVLYIATAKAKEYLEDKLGQLWGPHGIAFKILIVHLLSEDIRVGPNHELSPLLESYYRPEMEDEHTRKGGTSILYGYAGCGLPVVLSHNTPNNSIYPLWKDSPVLRPLFPRISRHTAA